jgi:hypothetical protein
MDVYCANCGEPWDLFHLRNDEVHETAAGLEMIDDRLNEEDWDKEMCKYGGLSREAALRACPKPEPQYKGEPWEGKLTPFWREQFKARGWEFGSNLAIVYRCSCCPSTLLRDKIRAQENEALPDAEERRELFETVDSLLGGDMDGAAVTIAHLERSRA